MTLRSRMSSIIIRPEQLELFALELESSLEKILVRNINLSSPVWVTLSLAFVFVIIPSAVWKNHDSTSSCLSFFPLIGVFTAFSACLEYNFVIYSLNIFKSNIHECWKIMDCIAQKPYFPSTNFEIFLHLTFIFIAFLACPEQNFVILTLSETINFRTESLQRTIL